MSKILITASHYEELCSEALKMLRDAGCDVILNESDIPYYSYEMLAKWAPEIDGAVIGMDRWDEAIFSIAPNLKVLARFGVGVDNIDLEAAKEHGIKVVNAAGQNSNAVAELCVGLILSCLRGIPMLNRKLEEGIWERFVGRELSGKTVGILGLGDIGGRVAKMLSGFNVTLLAYDPYPNPEKAEALNVTLADMDEVLRQSDVVTIHIPSIPATYHTMNADAFSKMKEGSYFINTARGALVDTDALCDAVESGHLAGAAVDVYEQEPLPADARILTIPGIICTPHTGAETIETYRQISLMTAQAVLDVLAGKDPKNWLNP